MNISEFAFSVDGTVSIHLNEDLFADLVLGRKIHPQDYRSKWIAKLETFDHVEVIEGNTISKPIGNGDTPNDALDNLAKLWSYKRVVVRRTTFDEPYRNINTGIIESIIIEHYNKK